MQRQCKDCGVYFPTKKGVGFRCPACQEKYRKEYKAEHNAEHNPAYWKKLPTNSHHSEYLQYAKFVKSYSDTELVAQVTNRIKDLKYAVGEERLRVKTLIKILETEYTSRYPDRQVEKLKALLDEVDNYVKDSIDEED
jgi:uncharacterized Zn finger protein (UPF0148 family)